MKDTDDRHAKWERLMAAGAHCYKLRRYATAIKQFEAAVKLAESFGARHVDQGRALFHLGTAHSKRRTGKKGVSLELTILYSA